jgi:hypothetical protein
MEPIHMSGLSCNEVCELLSDLIDVRRGELPHPDGTRLCQPAMRSAVESHVASCPACAAELDVLEQIGAAYSEFSVAELPAQHFASYGRVVRERMAGTASGRKGGARVIQAAPSFWRRWVLPTAGTAAAACAAFFASNELFDSSPARSGSNKPLTTAHASNGNRLPIRNLPNTPTPMTYSVPTASGVQPVDVVLNPREPSSLKKIEADEGRYGYVVLGEKPAPGGRPLLGVLLKTTRDVDRDQQHDPWGLMVWNVIDGSPAAIMGLQPGDYIVQANDAEFNSGSSQEAAAFFAALSQGKPGDQITLHIVRKSGNLFAYHKPMSATLGEYAPDVLP